jgi:polar amino acid transport system substrate-binding protein
MRTKFGLILLVVLAMVAAGCGDDDAGDTTTATTAAATTTTAADTTTTTAAATTTTEADACAIDQLNLVTPGTLTVATGEPAFPPWVNSITGGGFDDPESKEGFEAALAYEIASELGFADDDVEWVRTTFDEAITPGEKSFDFNLQQYSITAAREEVVDFSDPYYEVKQALVTVVGSAADGATTIEELKGLRLGAAIATTSLDLIESVIDPDTEASVYNDNTDVQSALIAGQIDAFVVDFPTAFFITAVTLTVDEVGQEGVIVGQFESPGDAPEEFGLLFADGNPLVPCVNDALAALRADGTLAALEQQWLVSGADVAVFG